MSTLTKALIIALTICSFFLCGIVVTYVANAADYRQKYNTIRTEKDAAVQKGNSAKTQLNENIAKTDREKNKLNNQIGSLERKLSEAQADLTEAERQKALLTEKVNNWTAIVMDFSKTAEDQGQLLKNTLSELRKTQAEQIKKDKELKQTTTTLVEKMAIISTLEEKNKRLLEERADLNNKLNQLLRQYGKVVAPSMPVTRRKSVARPASPVRPAQTAPAAAEDMGLKGQVTAVDSKHSMAEISIGRAQGVSENMKFHVTRGDEFICDILILDVDSERAVGILDLVQQMPRVGDKVSTNL